MKKIVRLWESNISSGIPLSKEITEKKEITKNDESMINIRKSNNLKQIRSLLNFKKSTQQLEDEMREGWN